MRSKVNLRSKVTQMQVDDSIAMAHLPTSTDIRYSCYLQTRAPSVKILSSIIVNRISPWYEAQLSRTQFGFRTGKGCNDAIYVCKQLQEIAHHTRRKLYTCFVDLTAAYDHVNREFLFTSIRNRLASGQATNTIEVLQAIYNTTRAFIAHDGPESMFETTSGMRQGGIESAPGFNLYLDYAMRVYRSRCSSAGIEGLHIGYRIPIESTNRAQRAHAPSAGTYDETDDGYADDLAVSYWSEDRLQASIEILHNVFSEFGLQINLGKTETMIWNWNSEADGPYPESIIKVTGTSLKNVETFKYLGVWMTNSDMHIGERELAHRANMAKAAFAEHKTVLLDNNVVLRTRITLLNGLVRSRLTYGCHAWRPTENEIRKLSSTYNNFLRRMIHRGFERIGQQPVINDESGDSNAESDDEEEHEIDYRFVITNKQLYDLSGTTDVRAYYEDQQRNWISHTIRAPNDDPIKILTFHQEKATGRGRKVRTILQRVVDRSNITGGQFIRESFQRKK